MSYADEVLADNPVHYARLEETSGSVVADEVGDNDGDVIGANLDVNGPVFQGKAQVTSGDTAANAAGEWTLTTAASLNLDDPA